jgi:hypothetical protein
MRTNFPPQCLFANESTEMLASQWRGTAIYVTLGMTVKHLRRAMPTFVGLLGNLG